MARCRWPNMVLPLVLVAVPNSHAARASSGAVRAVCAPDTRVPQGSEAQLGYRAINDDVVHHSVRAFPDGERSWARSPGVVDPIFLAPGDSASWVITVPDSAAPGTVHVTYHVLWDSGQDSCQNVIMIGATATTPPPVDAFSLGIPHPQPAHRGHRIAVTIALPDAAPATLETFDAAGRRLARRVLAGPGRVEALLPELARAAPGHYTLVLAHGERRIMGTAIVIP